MEAPDFGARSAKSESQWALVSNTVVSGAVVKYVVVRFPSTALRAASAGALPSVQEGST
jgi:hypothetical protein